MLDFIGGLVGNDGRHLWTARRGWQAAMRCAALTCMSLVLLFVGASARAWCFDEAAAEHGLSPSLLRAIAAAESDLNPRAVNRTHQSRTGTMDIGLMQINSSWLPTLQREGITERSLYDPCTNIRVGARILADLVTRFGDRWEAVGAYNAACSRLGGAACQAARSRYAWRVHRRLPAGSGTAAVVAPVQAPAPVRGPGLLAFVVAAPADRPGAPSASDPTNDEEQVR